MAKIVLKPYFVIVVGDFNKNQTIILFYFCAVQWFHFTFVCEKRRVWCSKKQRFTINLCQSK